MNDNNRTELSYCPDDAMLLNNFANLMMEKGNFSRAEELFKKTLNLKPVHPHSYFGLALLYRVTGHPEESLKVLDRLFILMPKHQELKARRFTMRHANFIRKLRRRRNQRQEPIKTRNNIEAEYCPPPRFLSK